MKYKFLILVFALQLTIPIRLSAQIANLIVNGSSTSFTMTSGDTITWSYNVSPIGASTTIQIWYDVNGNGTIDPGTDVLWQGFIQTDGDTSGNNGPPDMDGSANGTVLFMEPVGLAPGKYVMKFTEGGTSITVAGTADHLCFPTHTISGTVTPPPGKSAANIFVKAARSNEYQPNFWDGVTDASGNSQLTTTTLEPTAILQSFKAGDSVFENLVLYMVNSQIQGKVTINGSAPGYPIEVEGDNVPTLPGWGGMDTVYGTEMTFAMSDG